MNRWLSLLNLAYYSAPLRPIVAVLLVATGFVLATLCIGPVTF